MIHFWHYCSFCKAVTLIANTYALVLHSMSSHEWLVVTQWVLSSTPKRHGKG